MVAEMDDCIYCDGAFDPSNVDDIFTTTDLLDVGFFHGECGPRLTINVRTGEAKWNDAKCRAKLDYADDCPLTREQFYELMQELSKLYPANKSVAERKYKGTMLIIHPDKVGSKCLEESSILTNFWDDLRNGKSPIPKYYPKTRS